MLAQLQNVLLGSSLALRLVPGEQAPTQPPRALKGSTERRHLFLSLARSATILEPKTCYDLREILHGPHWQGVVRILVTFLLSFFLGSAGQRHHCWT